MEKESLYAWCAGIVDGEGYVSLSKGRYQKGTTVEVCNTDYRILKKLRDNFDGAIALVKRKDRPTHSPCWKWHIRGRNVIEFLEKVIPFLVSKKEKAEIVLSYAYTIGKKPIDANYRNDLEQALKLIN